MRASSTLFAVLAALLLVVQADNVPNVTYSTKFLLDTRKSGAQSRCTLVKPLSETQIHRSIKSANDIYVERTVRRNRVSLDEMKDLPRDSTAQVWIELFGGSREAVETAIPTYCPGGLVVAQPMTLKANLLARPPIIIKKIVNSGDPNNRIDVVFMGDGYTSKEKDKFFNDMQRLTDDMFNGETFAQYLPLFNVWSVFTPSVDSGIGVGGTPKNTTYALYRDGTELRGIYVMDPIVARETCAMVGTNACDYPALIANDDYYGGLGGEFVIATRSITSGTIVLRHEMGHNFGKVGEEYDGGQVYTGANSAPSLSGITWKHWLTNPNVPIREEQSMVTYTNRMWYNLQQGPYTMTFTSTGTYARWKALITISGAPRDQSISITLDGKPLAWTSKGNHDRMFYTYTGTTLSKGSHTIVVTGNGPFNGPIIQQLCSVDLNEYGDETTFGMDNTDMIAAYPTWDADSTKTYRPNNERCLMRNMGSTKFCVVCQENMWLQFLARIQLIDQLTIHPKTKVATIQAIPLAQLRAANDPFKLKFPSLANAEKYHVTWFKNGIEQVQFKDRFSANLTNAVGGANGNWKVVLKFTTPAVRKDPTNLLQSTRPFSFS